MSKKKITSQEKAECLGKIKHKTLSIAEMVLANMNISHDHILEIYPCSFCKTYHIGHKKGSHNRLKANPTPRKKDKATPEPTVNTTKIAKRLVRLAESIEYDKMELLQLHNDTFGIKYNELATAISLVKSKIMQQAEKLGVKFEYEDQEQQTGFPKAILNGKEINKKVDPGEWHPLYIKPKE